MIEIKKIDIPGEECIAVLEKSYDKQGRLLTDLKGTFIIGTVLSFTTREDGSVLIVDIDDLDDFVVINRSTFGP